ncbi:endolytic transglycosylase MltG [Aminobacterium mobile]|uniref:endolytic transglycosylase MltG n=1 Tax=Aminobacterium mobile TaxID=81467 RepID=UPI0004669B14|nr:endolytic transglycosylase MltG [Aminobacterium mobile]
MKKFIDILLLICSLGYFLLLCMIPTSWWNSQFPFGVGEPLPALVLPGQNAKEIADAFYKAGIVTNPLELRGWMARLGIDRTLKTGMYMIKKGTSWEVAQQLKEAVPSQEKVTIVPGSDLFSIKNAFPDMTEDEVSTLLQNTAIFPLDLQPLLPLAPETRVAFLLPDTYYVPEKKLEYVLKAGFTLWWKHFDTKIQNLSPHELLETAILASLVEREAKIDEERPLIAGIIKNRVAQNMPLQVDATIVYAWKREGENLSRVLFKHLEVDSPYNTYKKLGLPPTAICIPSIASWEAALKPAQTEYLYYVAGKDGQHFFATTYQGHLLNIRKIRGAQH